MAHRASPNMWNIVRIVALGQTIAASGKGLRNRKRWAARFAIGASRSLLVLIIFVTTQGCTRADRSTPSRDVVFVVPGAAGAGTMYNALIASVSARPGGKGASPNVRVVHWGAPPILFQLNFSGKKIHDDAEVKLQRLIEAWASGHSGGRVTLIGHSAGGGVVLGAMGRLHAPLVDRAILLHPSVSPAYDLAPALRNVKGTIDVFHSDRDTLFLKWRTGTFGGYDRVKIAAAGNGGFDTSSLDPTLCKRLLQYPYDPSWEPLGNTGGHFGPLARKFVDEEIVPLVQRDKAE